MSNKILFSGTTNSPMCWKNLAPLRFIERDGKKILQSLHVEVSKGGSKWEDVPLEEEVLDDR